MHDHAHDHAHGGHSHAHSHGTKQVSDRALVWAVVINLGLSVFEFGAGLISGSVALMADALHNTNDAAALVIAYVARVISRRGADARYTFGYRRAELIGALIQLTALILVGVYLVVEAIKRFVQPEPLSGQWMIAASIVAIVVDLGTVVLLWAMSKGSLNIRAAFLHNLSDAAASFAVLAGGAIVLWVGWTWVDPVLTLVIAGYILWMSVGMLRTTSRILMEGAPRGFDPEHLRDRVCSLDEVRDLHHLHVWELGEDRRALEAHVVVEESHAPGLRARVKKLLADEFEIQHSTLEFELPEDACQGKHAALIPAH